MHADPRLSPEIIPLLALCLVLVLDCPMRAAVDAGGAAGAIDAVFEPDQELHAVIHLAGDAFVQDLFEGAGDLVLPQRKKFDERFLRFDEIHAAPPLIASSAVCAGSGNRCLPIPPQRRPRPPPE